MLLTQVLMATPNMVKFFGHFHVLLVHVPIGILTLLAAMEITGRFKRWQHITAGRGFILLLLALAVVPTVVCGWLLASGGGYSHSTLAWHRWLGTSVGVLCVAMLAVFWWKKKPTLLYYALLAPAFIVMVAAAHFGGDLTFGSRYLGKYAPEYLRPMLGYSAQAAADSTNAQIPLAKTSRMVQRVHASEGLIFLSFLTALFVVGAGMTFLETVANPYTTVLGPIDAAVARINLAQSCNAIGWMLGPIVISYFILSKTAKADTSNATLYVPYLILAGLVALLIVAFIVSPVPDIHAPQEEQPATKPTQHSRPLLKEKHFVLAVVAQFFYVAGQTGIFSFFINYVKDPDYSPALPTWMANHLPKTMKFLHAGQWHITEYGAGIGLSVAFGCFLAGRFSGSAILRFAKAHITLGVYGLINTLMMALVCLNLGWISIIALMLSYFFMSIMYPTIFALGIRGLGEKTKLAASWIVMSIVGGAVMPMLMGWMADKWSMRVGFLMPLGCFVVIMLYGFMWQGFFRNDMEPEESATGPIIPSH